MKVSIDKTKCIMCGSCVAICPEVFEMKDDGSVDVKDQYKGVDIQDPILVEKVKQAQLACPATAIVTEG
ncbi:ferredoxin [Candidatus Dojkabacteria bacterium]|jgi:ferredoxin|nr:ferredoxin [Candidatus Dojkabacteria bacterium]HRY74178.1 ferredoxin [Candidatus Dojkabacteria bacterium]HRZ84699.1 ferredoxin [Candidatus Dojkabacteria bacterium]